MIVVKAVRSKSGFTLIELLVVISLLGLLAALVVPALKNFGRADATAASTRQLLDDLGRARQLALSQRTPVYVIFVPTNFWERPAYSALPQAEKDKGSRLFDKQLNSYALVTLGGVGDQPGRHSARYVSSEGVTWKSLPEGNFIALWKFGLRNAMNHQMVDGAGQPLTNGYGFIKGFNITTNIPFPSEDALPTAQGYAPLPYIAFDYNGQVESREDEFIPLARGTISHAFDPATRNPVADPPSVSENPPGNSTNSFNLVHLDWLTGRARVESPRIQ